MSLRVVFMGTPEFAVESLERILEAGHHVPLVVTVPDRKQGRGQRLTPSAVKTAALRRGLSVVTPESLKEESLIVAVRDARPDVICVVAFRILPEVLYTIPPLGSFNLHGSLLPRYRGAAPINRAIMAGETVTGVTTFFLQAKVDTGSMILQRAIPIGPDMTAGELHDVMKVVGADVVVETLRLIELGDVPVRLQDDTQATPAPKIFPADCVINWTLPSSRIHDHVRGLSPWPGAFTLLGAKRMKLLRTARNEYSSRIGPGVVSVDDGRLFVGTGNGSIEVLSIQLEGSRVMDVGTFLLGHRIENGTELGTE